MRLLVAIANHGSKNRAYLEQLLNTYRAFTFAVDIVVLSDKPKFLGPDVHVLVGAPTRNPWSLPFAHRRVFTERQDDYDLFVYSEDDTELTQAHVEAFLAVTEVLPRDRIAGFIRHEFSADGKKFYSTVHGTYRWDPMSVLRIGDHVFARYTNDHSGCYVLTRDQLKACIASGGFVTEPHSIRYDMLEAAATDPYTRCGLKKVVCISNLAAFSLHHLPDCYLGKLGIEASETEAQVARLMELEARSQRSGPAIATEADLDTIAYDRAYFDLLRPEILRLTRAEARRLGLTGPLQILSVGCERGLNEAMLIEAGHEVWGIPLDPVIAVSAQRRGIKTLEADIEAAIASLAGKRFDIVLYNNILQYVADPASLLCRFLPFTGRSGRSGLVVASFENHRYVGRLLRRWRSSMSGEPRRVPSSFAESRVHLVDHTKIRSWMMSAGIRPSSSAYDVRGRLQVASTLTAHGMDAWLGHTGVVSGVVDHRGVPDEASA